MNGPFRLQELLLFDCGGARGECGAGGGGFLRRTYILMPVTNKEILEYGKKIMCLKRDDGKRLSRERLEEISDLNSYDWKKWNEQADGCAIVKNHERTGE